MNGHTPGAAPDGHDRAHNDYGHHYGDGKLCEDTGCDSECLDTCVMEGSKCSVYRKHFKKSDADEGNFWYCGRCFGAFEWVGYPNRTGGAPYEKWHDYGYTALCHCCRIEVVEEGAAKVRAVGAV